MKPADDGVEARAERSNQENLEAGHESQSSRMAASGESGLRQLRGTAMARELKCSPHGLPMSQSQELATLARLSGYRVKTLAYELGCSCRWLEIQCRRRFALTPHAWLVRLRTEEIQKQARTGAPAKVLCQLVGFADAASFCHGLKRCMGCTLRELREVGRNGCSAKRQQRWLASNHRNKREYIVTEKRGRCQHELPTC